MRFCEGRSKKWIEGGEEVLEIAKITRAKSSAFVEKCARCFLWAFGGKILALAMTSHPTLDERYWHYIP